MDDNMKKDILPGEDNAYTPVTPNDELNTTEDSNGEKITANSEAETIPIQQNSAVEDPQYQNPQPDTPPYSSPQGAVYGNSQYARPPVNNQVGYDPRFTQYSNPPRNPYVAYGNPAMNQTPTEAVKKESKGKKKGGIIAIVILALVFIIAAVVFIASIFGKLDKEKSPVVTDDTQMNLVEVPTGNDENMPDGKLTAGQVYDKVNESSVGVLVYTRNQQAVYSEGSGVVMGTNKDGTKTYIITCAHVLDVKNPNVVVQCADGTQYDAVIVGVDAKTDIGLLSVNSSELKAAEFAVSDSLKVGDTVYAIGNPGGTQFFGSFTEGMVSAIGRPIDSPVGYEVACVQHTAAINPGNSGGALVNEYGQIIGINSSKIASTEYEGMGFAVPTATVKEVVDELIKNGHVTNRPVLGINFIPASQNRTYSIVVKANELPSGSIVITSIMNGSDLLNCGVQEGDMVVAVNGTGLDSYNTLLETIEKSNVGDKVTLTICRVDANYKVSKFDVEVKLVEDSSTSEKVENSAEEFNFPF